MSHTAAPTVAARVLDVINTATFSDGSQGAQAFHDAAEMTKAAVEATYHVLKAVAIKGFDSKESEDTDWFAFVLLLDHARDRLTNMCSTISEIERAVVDEAERVAVTGGAQ